VPSPARRIAETPPEIRRSGASHGLSSLLAQVWFGLNFFVSFPSLVLWWADTGLRPPPGPNLLVGGAVIVAAHVALIAVIAGFVRTGLGTQMPLDPPRELVRRGAYRRVRNPMYLLYVAIALGLAILYRSLPLLAYAVVFALCIHLYVVLVEEKGLRRRFGPLYTEYCRNTGRWLPRKRSAQRAAGERSS
jgi:protein-S-isoprenylcysteine O-methyltransferase Ste14